VLRKSACFHEVTRFLHVKTANGFIKIKGLQGGLAAKILSSRLKITLRALSHIESDSNPPFSLFRRIGGGTSLLLTRLRNNCLDQGKIEGKSHSKWALIRFHSVTPHPKRLLKYSVTYALPPEQGINRESTAR